MNEFKQSAMKTIAFFASQLSGICDGRISAGFVETFKIFHQGQKIELKQIASVYEEHGRVCILPYDQSSVSQVAKELKDSGLNAYAFSRQQVVVNVPPRCGEERDRIIAHIKRLAEDAKVAIRNARKKCKQRNKGTKDEMHKLELKLQEVTDKSIKEIDEMANFRSSKLR